MNLLIVDDDKHNRYLLKSILSNSSQEIKFIEAENGLEAIDIISTIKVDLILLDIFMPIMNGEEFLNKVNLKNLNIPFVIISANINEQKLDQYYGSGASECIGKPYYLNEVQHKVMRLLK